MPDDDASPRGGSGRPLRLPPDSFRAEVVDDEFGRPIVVVTGEVDMAVRDELWDRIEESLRRDARLVLDMRATSFMDSTGLGALAMAHQATGQMNEGVVLRSPQPAVLHVLQVSGLDQVVTIDSD